MSGTATIQSEQASFCPPGQRRYVLIAAILASSMGFIDSSVLAIAIPALRADLGASLSDAQWVSNGYVLWLGSLILLGGAAGDQFGLRRVFILGIALFVVASLACAVAPTALLLIGARAIQGIGAAFMVPSSLAIIAKAYPRNERGKAIGMWAAASSAMTVFGPVVGGFVLTALGDWSWRLIFAINLPLGAIAIALLWFRVPPDRPAGERRLDVIGALLATVSLLLLAFGLTGGSEAGLLHLLGYSVGGLVVLGLFIAWERYTKAPMLPLRLFANRGFSGANGLTLVLYFALSAVLFFLPMTMIAGWGVSPAVVALALLPFGAMLTVLSSFSGAMADRFGPGPPIAAGSVLVGLAYGGLALTAHWQSVWGAVLPLICLMGLGMGLVVSPLSTAVMTSVEDTDTGVASGVNNAISRVAGLLAVAMMGFVAIFVFERSLGGAAEFALYFGLPPESVLPVQIEMQRRAATNSAFAAIAMINAVLCFVAAGIALATLESRLPGKVSKAG